MYLMVTAWWTSVTSLPPLCECVCANGGMGKCYIALWGVTRHEKHYLNAGKCTIFVSSIIHCSSDSFEGSFSPDFDNSLSSTFTPQSVLIVSLNPRKTKTRCSPKREQSKDTDRKHTRREALSNAFICCQINVRYWQLTGKHVSFTLQTWTDLGHTD